MQLPSPQQYLIKTKTNFTYYFYLKKDRSIAIKTFSSNNIFVEEALLISRPVLDYSVTIDSNDYIHLICITSEGSLTYYIQQNSQWNERQISKLDIKSNVYRNLVIIINNKDTHVLCNKTNFTNPAITSIEHMYWNDKSIKKSSITTYLPGKYHSPFQIDVDSLGNVHLVYKVFHKTNNQLSYTYFSIFNKKWSNSEIISNPQDDHSHPHMLIDKSDNLHLVWCTIEDNNFTLKYKRKINVINFKSKWSSIRNLSPKNSNNISPILLQEGSTLKVLSRQNDSITEVFSEDYGTNWRVGNSGDFHVIEGLFIFKYSTNSDLEKSNSSITQAYGTIDNSIFLIGTKLFNQPIKEKKEDSHEKPQKNPSNSPEILKTQIPTPIQAPVTTTIQDEKEPSTITDSGTKINNSDELKLGKDLKKLVEEVQGYINRMVIEIERLEETKKSIEINRPQEPENFTISSSFQQFQNELSELNLQLTSIENEQFQLQKELDEYQIKIYSIEDRMIHFKKQLLELEDKVMKIPALQSSFVSRIKSIFK